MLAQLKSAPAKPRRKRQLISQSGAPSRSQTTPAAKKSATKPPARTNRANKPTKPPEISAVEPPTFEPSISPFGDEFYDENGIDWHPVLDEDPEMLLDDLERGSEKEMMNCSISEEEFELNYNYMVTLMLFLRRLAKGSKICARYKMNLNLISSLKLGLKR